jgi:hypothetical protein
MDVAPEGKSYVANEVLVSPNKSLQRSGTHKVLGRGRLSESAHERWCARVLNCRRAAAELSR